MAVLETRIPPLVLLVLSGMAIWLSAREWPDEVLTHHWLGFAATLGSLPLALVPIVAGLVIMLVAVRQFRRERTTLDPLRPGLASVLVTDGIFAVTRNPMYLGMALILGGWGMLYPHPTAVLVLGVFVFWLTRFQIMPEERRLRLAFGDAYVFYTQRVRRWM